MLQLRFLWVIMLTLMYVGSAEAQFNGQIPERYELEVGVGAAVLYDAQIQGATNSGRGNHAYISFYPARTMFSFKGGYDFMTTFDIGDFQLSTDFVFLHLEAAIPLLQKGRKDLSVFGFAGPIYQTNTFGIRTDDFLVNTADEKVRAFGLSTGVGLRGRTASWVVSAYGNLTLNNADFAGGSFERTRYKTGAERLIFSIGYIIKRGRSEISNCPTFQ